MVDTVSVDACDGVAWCAYAWLVIALLLQNIYCAVLFTAKEVANTGREMYWPMDVDTVQSCPPYFCIVVTSPC